jgi:flagellar motor switch protein FliN/FliY
VERTALDQAEIEALLNQESGGGGAAAEPPAAARSEDAAASEAKPDDAAPAPTPPASGPLPQSSAERAQAIEQPDLELLLQHAEQALSSISEAPGDVPPGVSAFKLRDLAGSPPSTEVATVDLMSDVQLDLTIELGRTHMYLEDILRLRKGAVVPLDKLAGDPVDVYANGRLIARGEVLVLNDNFCVRVAELIEGDTTGL